MPYAFIIERIHITPQTTAEHEVHQCSPAVNEVRTVVNSQIHNSVYALRCRLLRLSASQRQAAFIGGVATSRLHDITCYIGDPSRLCRNMGQMPGEFV